MSDRLAAAEPEGSSPDLVRQAKPGRREDDVDIEVLEAAPQVRVLPGKVDHHPEPSVAVREDSAQCAGERAYRSVHRGRVSRVIEPRKGKLWWAVAVGLVPAKLAGRVVGRAGPTGV